MSDLPLLIETEALVSALDQPDLLIVDTSSRDNYLRHHIPGAVHIAPSELQRGEKPAVGKIPREADLQALSRASGSAPNTMLLPTTTKAAAGLDA